MSQVDNLHKVYETYGPKSKELAEHLLKYIYYLLNKYYQGWNDPNSNSDNKEDIVQGAYCKIYKSLRYFDPKKGNLATFLYRSIRNFCQIDQFYENKHVSFKDETGDDLTNVQEKDQYEHEEIMFIRTIISNLDIKYDDQFIFDLSMSDISSKPIQRLISWRKFNCHN